MTVRKSWKRRRGYETCYGKAWFSGDRSVWTLESLKFMIKNWKAVEWLSVTESNIKIIVDKVLRSRYSTKSLDC